MSDSTSFVLRWEIDNAVATLSTGCASSKDWTEGGFKWSVSMRKNQQQWADYFLRCGVDHDRPWDCKAEVRAEAIKAGEQRFELTDALIYMKDTDSRVIFRMCNYWPYLTQPGHYCINDKVTIEFHVKILRCSGGMSISPLVSVDLTKFVSPIETSNVTLVIEGKKLEISKEYLAMHSPVFNRMFFGDYIEKNKKEVEIKDVVYEEFLDLLMLIFPEGKDITDGNALHIAKLADRFQIKKASVSNTCATRSFFFPNTIPHLSHIIAVLWGAQPNANEA